MAFSDRCGMGPRDLQWAELCYFVSHLDIKLTERCTRDDSANQSDVLVYVYNSVLNNST